MIPFMNDHHEHWVSKARQQSHCTIHTIAKATAHRAREVGWWFKVLFLVQRTSVPSIHMVTHNHRTDPVTTLDQVWTAARDWGMPGHKDGC